MQGGAVWYECGTFEEAFMLTAALIMFRKNHGRDPKDFDEIDEYMHPNDYPKRLKSWKPCEHPHTYALPGKPSVCEDCGEEL